MATFMQTDAAFDMYNMDLNGVFQGASLGLNESYAQAFGLSPSIGMFFDGTSVLVVGPAVPHDNHVQIDVVTPDPFDLYGTGMNPDGSGACTTGTINWLKGSVNPGQGAIEIMGGTVAAADFSAAVATASGADDLTLLLQMFNGNDFFFGSTASDVMLLGAGADIYVDRGGSDRVEGRSGRDLIQGGLQGTSAGDDTLLGGSGDDILELNSGNGWVSGGSGQDTLILGMDNDHARGGAGADTFIFPEARGRHVIVDFNPAVDDLVVPALFAEQGDLHFRQHGGTARIIFGDWSVSLRHVDLADLDQDNLFLDGPLHGDANQRDFVANFVLG